MLDSKREVVRSAFFSITAFSFMPSPKAKVETRLKLRFRAAAYVVATILSCSRSVMGWEAKINLSPMQRYSYRSPELSGAINLSRMDKAFADRGLADRLLARLDATGKNATAASKEAGLSASAIRNILEGKSESPRAKTLKALARVLGTTEKWLIDGEGAETPSPASLGAEGNRPLPRFFSPDRNMPVYSAAEGGNGFIIVSKDAIEYVERPHILESVTDAYAILITGESMIPAFEPEDKAWVNPRLPPTRNKDCVFYEIDEYNDSRATIKRLIAWTDEYWLVQQYNPPKKFKLPRPQWGRCHRVVGKFSA